MNNEKEMLYSIAELVDDKNFMKEIIDGVKSGKYNVIRFEHLTDSDDTVIDHKVTPKVFIIKNKYKDVVVSSLNFIKDHITSIISSSLSTIEKCLKS
jgi:hypothetical protein